jgi:hypothetical protein
MLYSFSRSLDTSGVDQASGRPSCLHLIHNGQKDLPELHRRHNLLVHHCKILGLKVLAVHCIRSEVFSEVYHSIIHINDHSLLLHSAHPHVN